MKNPKITPYRLDEATRNVLVERLVVDEMETVTEDAAGVSVDLPSRLRSMIMDGNQGYTNQTDSQLVATFFEKELDEIHLGLDKSFPQPLIDANGEEPEGPLDDQKELDDAGTAELRDRVVTTTANRLAEAAMGLDGEELSSLYSGGVISLEELSDAEIINWFFLEHAHEDDDEVTAWLINEIDDWNLGESLAEFGVEPHAIDEINAFRERELDNDAPTPGTP